MEDKKEPPSLNGKRLRTFELKFVGETYQKIAQETGYSEGHLKRMFMREGRWRELYDTWEAKRIEEIETEVKNRIRKRVSEAMTVQEHALTQVSTNLKEATRAARDILDRAGLKAPERLEISDPDDKAEKVLKALERRKEKKL